MQNAENVGSFKNEPMDDSKLKLSQVTSLNKKEVDCHLNYLKTSVDSTHDMMLLYSNMHLLACVGTDDIVEIKKIENIDENFRHKHFLASQNSETGNQSCKRYYNYFSMVIVSLLKNGSHDTNVISSKAK